jgi:hypothetical protein
MNYIASRHNEKAHELQQQGRIEEAIIQYQKAIAAAPRWSVPWYNLGLLRKHQHLWGESLRCNQRAVALDPSDEAAWWNLGIAATALEDWVEARRAWKSYGIEIPDGEGPIEMTVGITPIRINPRGSPDGGPDGAPEVVWCRRIDPARAIIESIPMPQSGHRYGDLLLHDGEPKGFRRVSGREVPVFDELQLLAPSEYGTFEVIIDGAGAEEIEALTEQADKNGLAAEDWSANIRMVCKACSEGRPDNEGHTHDVEQTRYRRIGIAALSEAQVRQTLENWLAQTPQAEIEEINCALPPAFIN